ncbi:hypothetical protein TWF506_004144 [Arthrobotrys conoides]|uniref:Uncharacterized protein n=1 Tax=Arthrobotrys conoides TaxID=74498 RepID=A0AAN8NCE7_9PEZI
MSSSTEADDPFVFRPIQLRTSQGDLGFHSKNDGDENQRPDIVDDLCMGLHVQARIDRVIHGSDSTKSNGKPATLIVFGFRFHGLHNGRRLRTAEINILFQDLDKRPRKDPAVIGLWPNGDFTLSETPVTIQNTSGVELGGEVGMVGAAGTLAFKLERQSGYQHLDRSTVIGSITLDMKVRNYGLNNAVRITLEEDGTNKTGVITDLRVPVLLSRKNDDDRFTACVRVTATGNFFQNSIKGLRNLTGQTPANDPVIFKPGLQYLRPPTLSADLERNLAAEVDEQNLGEVNLENFGAALGSTYHR